MNDKKMIDYYKFLQTTYLNQTSNSDGECAGYVFYAMILLAKGRNLTSWFRKKFNNANNSFAMVNYLQESYLNRSEHIEYYDYRNYDAQLDNNITLEDIIPFHDEIPEVIIDQQLISPAVDLFEIAISSDNKAHAIMAYSQIINGEMVYGFFDPNHCVIIFNDKDLLYDYIKNHIVKYYSDYTEIASTQMNPLISPIDSSIRLKYSDPYYKLIRKKFAKTLINTMNNAKKAKDNHIKLGVEFQDYLQYELSFNRELKKALKPDTIITQENIDNICSYIYEFAISYDEQVIDSYGFDKFVYPKILGVRNDSYSNFAEFLNSLEKINPNLKINVENFRESIIRQKIDNATNAETLEKACIFVGILDASSSFDKTIINDNKHRENIDLYTINNKILDNYKIFSFNDINKLIVYFFKKHNGRNNYAFMYQLRKFHFEGQMINTKTLAFWEEYYNIYCAPLNNKYANVRMIAINKLIMVNCLEQKLTINILEDADQLSEMMKTHNIDIIDLLDNFNPGIIINNRKGITKAILQSAIIKYILNNGNISRITDNGINAIKTIIDLYTPLITNEAQYSNTERMMKLIKEPVTTIIKLYTYITNTEQYLNIEEQRLNIERMMKLLIKKSMAQNRIDILEKFNDDIIKPVIIDICKHHYFNIPLNVVKYLIEKQILDLYDNCGAPLRHAIYYNREDVIKYLIDKMDASSLESEHLVGICQSNSFEVAKFLIDKNPQLIDSNIGSKIFAQQPNRTQNPNFLEIIKFLECNLESKQNSYELLDFYRNTVNTIKDQNKAEDTLNYLEKKLMQHETNIIAKSNEIELMTDDSELMDSVTRNISTEENFLNQSSLILQVNQSSTYLQSNENQDLPSRKRKFSDI